MSSIPPTSSWIEGSNEGAVESFQRLVREVVGFVFMIANLLKLAVDLRKRADHFSKMLGRRHRVPRDVFEQVEENRIFRKQVEHEAGILRFRERNGRVGG
jgi:hypothetical protein